MTTTAHKRHTDLPRPRFGRFGRAEWAFVGTRCETIKLLAANLLPELSKEWNCGYADATHHDDEVPAHGRLGNGAVVEYVEHSKYGQINQSAKPGTYELNSWFNSCDLVLVNGNHHQAAAQVVIIDVDKIESLRKRMQELNHVELILIADNASAIFDFVKEKIPHWERLPVLPLHDTDGIVHFFRKRMAEMQPPLNGLVLAGGKSERLGHDKTLLNWHGKPQMYHMADMLGTLCDEVYISCREEQLSTLEAGYDGLPDTFTGLGPYGALLSAFRYRPGHAWLVVASDLALLSTATLHQLAASRQPHKLATAFQSPHDQMPEPLAAIWEPKAYEVALKFLAKGISCPRKILMNNPVNVVAPDLPNELHNLNTPDDEAYVKNILGR